MGNNDLLSLYQNINLTNIDLCLYYNYSNILLTQRSFTNNPKPGSITPTLPKKDFQHLKVGGIMPTE